MRKGKLQLTMSRQKDKEERVNQQVAVVTGGSSGIGYETSLMLARNGFHTYATMRKLEDERIKSDNRYSQK